jgi:hypothetical protein
MNVIVRSTFRWLGLLITMLPAVVVAAPLVPQDGSSLLPGRMQLHLESIAKSLVTVSLPLGPVDAQIQKSLREAGAKDPSVPFRLDSAGFTEYSEGSFTLAYQAHIEGRINAIGQGFNCQVLLRFAIPNAPLPAAVVQDMNSEINCQTGALFNLVSWVADVMTTSIRGAINRAMFNAIDPNDPLVGLQHDDPELSNFIATAHLQGSYCAYQQMQGICLKIGWISTDEIARRMRQLIASAPVATGNIGNFDYDSEIAQFKGVAHRERSVRDPNYSFPAKYDPTANPPDDSGDMAIFGGLLCLAGEAEGCTLLQNSQSADGRFWRSPNHVDVVGSDFSGDQINGIFAFLETRKESAALSRYLHYISGNAMQVPPFFPIDTAYSSCAPDPNMTCELAGSEWLVLNALARKLGVANAVPSDVVDPIGKFGDQMDDLIWPAAFAPRGYTLHLIAVKIAIDRLLGHRSDTLTNAAAIIAAREPENPFFLYLHLGPDASILPLLKRKCYVDVGRTSYTQWQWERSEIAKDGAGKSPWETSMAWDCVFMYSLLKNHIPIGP